MNWNDFIARLCQVLFSFISPEIREMLENFVKILEDKAKQTPNPFDDMAVSLLKAILGMD